MTELDNIDVRSLSTSALLVRTTFGSPSKTKKAKEKTAEVQQEEQTTAVTVNKTPYKGTKLIDITKLQTAVRQHINDVLTLPWENNGNRLLPMGLYEEFIGYWSEQKAEYDELLKQFKEDIPVMVMKAQNNMKALYDPNDYPDPDCEMSINNFMARFKFDHTFSPVPEAGHFIVDVGEQAIEDMKSEIVKLNRDRMELGRDSLWAKGYDILKQWQDMPNKQVVKETTVHTHALDLINMIDKANMTGDSNLKALRYDLQEIVDSTNIDMLRDKSSRDMEKDLLAEKAEGVLSKFDF